MDHQIRESECIHYGKIFNQSSLCIPKPHLHPSLLYAQKLHVSVTDALITKLLLHLISDFVNLPVFLHALTFLWQPALHTGNTIFTFNILDFYMHSCSLNP